MTSFRPTALLTAGALLVVHTISFAQSQQVIIEAPQPSLRTATAPTVQLLQPQSLPTVESVQIEAPQATIALSAPMYSSVQKEEMSNSIAIQRQEAVSDSLFLNTTNLPLRSIDEVPVEDLTVIPPGTPLMTSTASMEREKIPTRQLKSTQQGGRLSGQIRGLKVDVYHFNATAGQQVHISRNNSYPYLEYGVFSPSLGMHFATGQVLPATGMYELRIVQNRHDAARNKTPRSYDIVFNLQ